MNLFLAGFSHLEPLCSGGSANGGSDKFMRLWRDGNFTYDHDNNDGIFSIFDFN